MLCEHLKDIENDLIEAGIAETYGGTPWSKNCREWVYFDIVLDVEKIKEKYELDPCVVIHENLDPKSGQERGVVCEICHDAIMGKISGKKMFP
ncbi:hypothetical protein ACFL2O_00185 [Thermodesulfobacteriota bacterium]